MKENEYVVIDDIYFTKVDGDKYLITDGELSKLIIKYRCLEREYKNLQYYSKRHIEGIETKAKKYYTMAHVYKVELGRCRRKLTMIYKEIPAVDIDLDRVGILRISFKKFVNWLKK